MKRLIFFLAVLCVANSLFAQENMVKGTVLAFNKYPLKNITVTAKKSKNQVLTNENGAFSIAVKKNDILIIAVWNNKRSQKVLKKRLKV